MDTSYLITEAIDDLIENNPELSSELDHIKDLVDDLVEHYDNRENEMQNEIDACNERIDELEDDIKGNDTDLEDFATSILSSFRSSAEIVNLGEALSLAEDLKKLLSTKYNISIGTL